MDLWEKHSPECDDDVIPAEIIILVENTLNGPEISALYTEVGAGWGAGGDDDETDMDIMSSCASPRKKPYWALQRSLSYLSTAAHSWKQGAADILKN